MSIPWTRVEKLSNSIATNNFASGQEVGIDSWLRKHALHELDSGRVITHVCVNDKDQVVGFFSHTLAVCNFDAESNTLRKKYCSGSANTAPAVLLAKMGLSSDIQGQGHGRRLCIQALHIISQAAKSVGGRLIVVDALDDGLVPFYQSLGFLQLKAQPRRLVMKTSTASAISAQAAEKMMIL